MFLWKMALNEQATRKGGQTRDMQEKSLAARLDPTLHQ
jgi:hypothetical protein